MRKDTQIILDLLFSGRDYFADRLLRPRKEVLVRLSSMEDKVRKLTNVYSKLMMLDVIVLEGVRHKAVRQKPTAKVIDAYKN